MLTDKTCRGCGVRLTTTNARTYEDRHSFRWVGACRECESAETQARTREKASA